MSERFPAQAYKDNVLSDCFADAKQYLLEHYLDVDRAHVLMLGEQGIVTHGELSEILRAIEKLNVETIRRAEYDGSVEDLFYFIQRAIAAEVGDEDIAGKLHTARSRNDIDVTIYRLRLREQTLDLIDACTRLQSVFLNLAAQHHDSLMPAYTHTQPAQPTTIAHYLLAMAENTGRDVSRLKNAFDNLNHCPLGACAITTTGFPINRHRVAELLGFSRPTRNSYGSIASVDYFTELLGATSAMLINVGKFAQEFLLMAMAEFNVIRLPDGYVQASSIMPQKRNPVAIEHVRAIASKALGQVMGVMTSVHNTPFGDINDVEDDLQPLNFSAVRDAVRAVSLLSDALSAAEFNLELLRSRAEGNFITVTELADVIVRREGLPFSLAHSIVAHLVKQSTEADRDISYEMLKKATLEQTNRDLNLSEAEFDDALSAVNFVNVRAIYGGPAPAETRAALEEQRQIGQGHQLWLRNTRSALKQSSDSLTCAIDKALAED